MQNAQQILESNILKLDESKGKAAQVGYDLSLKAVARISSIPGENGAVLKDQTLLATYYQLPVQHTYTGETGMCYGWFLEPGAYDITFHEGCHIPANRTGMIRQRSSLLRNGTVIASSIFDPGFKTDNMGTVMIVNAPIFIEQDARVAQIYFHENEPGELYEGQWQADKQRNK